MKYLGQWVCEIKNPDSHFHRGFVNLLTVEQGFVKDVRLPRHIIPETYDLQLTPFLLEVHSINKTFTAL